MSEPKMRKSNDEHKAILEAIKNKDTDLAEKLAHTHVENSLSNIERIGTEKIGFN